MISTILIVLVIVVVLVAGVSLALGRSTYEVDSARDTEYLELEGTWVRYNVMGGGPPVVLVHGWLSSSSVWDNLAGRLSQRFTVYTLDLTGFGESDKPLSGYGVRYGSRLIYAFCAHFGLTRASIIGHDLGGNMAVKLAADHPDIAGRLVLVATPANEEQIDLPTPLWAATLPVVGPIFYVLGRVVRPVREMWMRPFVSEPEDLTEEVVGDAAASTPAAMSQTLSVGKREIGGGRLARQARIIKVPVLIVAGEEDQIVDPQAAGVWARSLDQADVCLMDECGHMPMIERIGEFNAQILAFLTGDSRYLEYVERAPEATENVEDDEREGAAFAGGGGEDFDDTMDLDARQVRDENRDEKDEDESIGLDEPEADDRDDAPAFGPPPGEDDHEIHRPLERDSRERDSRADAREESTHSDEARPENTRERRITEKMRREEEVRRREATGDEARDEPDDESDDAPPPVVRRIGDRLSNRRRRSSEVGENEASSDDFDALTDDETSELDPPKDETPASAPEAPTPPPRPRRRPRRESSGDDEGSVPEVPSDLFNWGETWDEDIKSPREERQSRRPRRSTDSGDEPDVPPNGDPPRS